MKGDGGGGPRFRSVGDIERRIEAYFAECGGEVLRDEDTGSVLLDKKNRPVMSGARPPTLAGLALALGFSTRQALKRYRGKPEYEAALQRGLTRIEQFAEEKLYDKECSAGAKFILQNDFEGWQAEAKDEAVAGRGDDILDEIMARLGEEEQGNE